jgi:hypothetical protein
MVMAGAGAGASGHWNFLWTTKLSIRNDFQKMQRKLNPFAKSIWL